MKHVAVGLDDDLHRKVRLRSVMTGEPIQRMVVRLLTQEVAAPVPSPALLGSDVVATTKRTRGKQPKKSQAAKSGKAPRDRFPGLGT